MTMSEFLTRFPDAKRSGGGFVAKCPAHEDNNPSLSIRQGETMILVKCHARCATADVLHSVGLGFADLRLNGDGMATKAERRIVAAYDYKNKDGALLFQVVRFDPKDFRQRRPDGNGGYTWNLNGTPRVPYHLPELLAGDPTEWVLIVEGEKDVDNLRAIGLTATCNPQGAGKWGKLSDDSALHGRRVAILPDRDEPGHKHAIDVANRLHGKAAEVRIADLPTTLKDASDFIDMRRKDGLTDDQIKMEILAAVEAAPVFTPTNTPTDDAGDHIRLSELGDRFISEEIRPLWHREGRAVYSEKQGREIAVTSLWHCVTDRWVDAVSETAEAHEKMGYKAKLGLLKDAVLMAAGRAMRGLPEGDSATDGDELRSRVVAWLTEPRQFRTDSGQTISESFWDWAMGLAPGGGWIQCHAFPVFGRMDGDRPTIAVRGEYLSRAFSEMNRKLAGMLRKAGLVETERTIKVTAVTRGNAIKVWQFTPAVGEVLGWHDPDSAVTPVTPVTEKPCLHARTREKDTAVTVTDTRMCAYEVCK